MALSKRATIAGVAGAGLLGSVLAGTPPALAVAVVGNVMILGVGAYATYHSSQRVRDLVDIHLLNPPETRKALPAPKQDTNDLLTALLKVGPAVTGETKPHRVIPAEPAPIELEVSFHPDLAERYAEAVQLQLADCVAPTRAVGAVVDILARGLCATAVRIAAEPSCWDRAEPVMALFICPPPNADYQERLTKRVAAAKRHETGRASGVLVAIARTPAVERPTVQLVTPAARPIPDEPVEEVEELPSVELPPLAAPALPPIKAPARASVARKAPSQPYPMARLVGDGKVQTIEVTIGRGRDGEWFHMPLKHGIVTNSTGGGKTNIFDLLVGQVQALEGVEVWYGTAKPYVPIDGNDDTDRRPLVDGIPDERKALGPEELGNWLWRAHAMMIKRGQDMRANPGWFPKPAVVFLDEYKAYLTMYSDAKVGEGQQKMKLTDWFKSLVRQIIILGRECGVSFVFTAQDGYCESVGLSRGELRNLGLRVCHPGMDANTLSNILPDWTPAAFDRAGPHEWVAANPKATGLVTIPRVSHAMYEAWGLARADDGGDEEQEIIEVTPEWTIEDVQLQGWVRERLAGGDRVTINAAIQAFWGAKTTDKVVAMRDAFVRAGLIKKE